MTIAAASLFPGRSAVYEHSQWGYPKGGARRVALTDPGYLLLVVHVTGNSRLPSALAEAQYSARDGSGASFPFVTNRNGTMVQCYDPFRCAPWTNGDSNDPNMALSTIARIHDGNPYSANEFTLATNENVGYEPGYPLTSEQIEANAQLAAWLHLEAKRRGVLIPLERVRICGHRDINNVTRHNCPTSGDLEALLDRIIARARQIVGQSTPPQEDDVAIAPPPYIIEKLPGATVTLEAGKTYNAFQFEGLDDAGKPILRRLNDLVYTKTSTADVIYRGSWAAGDSGWLISPWAYLPIHGWQSHVWWSKSPLPEPKVNLPPPAVADCAAQDATIAQQAQIIADQKTQLAAMAPRIAAKDAALDVALAHEQPHVDVAARLRGARAV